ncbi:Uncharacterised protein [Candidatus Gugararchaeum adminiculabundum]|nr:Uncharacterised protein [Candidatus Gugararchaeum adminiculabundum]
MRFAAAIFFVSILAIFIYAEVPEHAPSLDSKCGAGWQWSRGIAGCAQADCPADVGRTYTYGCKCPEGKKCCYENQLMKSVIDSTGYCPGETPPVAEMTGVISAVQGDVECSTDGGKTFAPCGVGTKIKKGDYVSTGFGSSATVNFSYGSVQTYSTTQFRIDEYSNASNIERTQMFLRVGSVAARIERHTNAIRSDFSVVTPTASSSIRGSAMDVSYDNETNVTTVTVTEDVAFVKGVNDGAEVQVSQGETYQAASDGNAVKSETPNGTGRTDTGTGSGTANGNGSNEGTTGAKGKMCGIIFVPLALLAGILIARRN